MLSALLFVLAACRATPPAGEPAPAPEAAASAQEDPVRLILDPAAVSYDEAAGTATFSPGSAVMSASYTHYVLDLASLEAALGGRPEGPVAVLIEVTGEQTRSESPDDPSLPSPEGGFRITTVTGRVIGLDPDSAPR